MLPAEALRHDPRLQQAKDLIAQAVAEYSAGICDVAGSDPHLSGAFAKIVEEFCSVRGAPPIWPYFSSGLGNGPYVQLADGSVKLDFIVGIGVHGCGHNHPRLIAASIDAAIEDTVMQGNLQQNIGSVRMLQRLTSMASASGAPLCYGMLSTSGAMANENALKLAFHRKQPAQRIIAFDNAFAGRSIALASLTDRPAYRNGVPLAIAVDYLPFLDPHHPQRSTRWAVNELHRILQRYPNQHAAFWAEPIAGEGGYYPGSHEFFSALCRPLRDAGIPVVFDEVQTFTRTSRPFAFQHYGLDEFADIVTLGKITQVCATLYKKEFMPTGPILSQTFTGATSSIATGLVTLDILDELNCFGDEGANMQRHRYFADGLAELSRRYPSKISGPFGEGMMMAFTPGDGSATEAKSFMMKLFDAGLMGFLAGANPTRIRFLPPPGITTSAHIDAALKIIEQTLAGAE